MRQHYLDLIAAVIIAALNVLWVLLPGHTPVIGIILALPLVFLLPGYALTEVLFHKQALGASHRLVLSLGLSLAIDVLGGLILNMLPAGLQATSWAALLGLLTAAFSLPAAFLRRGTVSSHNARPLRFRFIMPGCILFGLAATVAIFSLLYAVIGAAQQPYPGFTQLWMVPVAQPGENCTVRLGVRSFESAPTTYRIVMTINGAQMTTWPSVVLLPQGEWDRVEPITSGGAGSVSVGVQLYRFDRPGSVYRQVHYTFHKCGTSRVMPSSYPVLAGAYNGIINGIPANLTTNLSLTTIQHREKEL